MLASNNESVAAKQKVVCSISRSCLQPIVSPLQQTKSCLQQYRKLYGANRKALTAEGSHLLPKKAICNHRGSRLQPTESRLQTTENRLQQTCYLHQKESGL